MLLCQARVGNRVTVVALEDKTKKVWGLGGASLRRSQDAWETEEGIALSGCFSGYPMPRSAVSRAPSFPMTPSMSALGVLDADGEWERQRRVGSRSTTSTTCRKVFLITISNAIWSTHNFGASGLSKRVRQLNRKMLHRGSQACMQACRRRANRTNI